MSPAPRNSGFRTTQPEILPGSPMTQDSPPYPYTEGTPPERLRAGIYPLLERQRASLLKAIGSGGALSRYPVGGIVEWYLENPTPTTMEVAVDVSRYGATRDQLERCIRDLLDIQPLLRSTIRTDGAEPVFEEPAGTADFFIPEVSVDGEGASATGLITQLSSAAADWLRATVKPSSPQFCCLLILNGGAYSKMLFGFTHKIVDAEIYRIMDGYFRLYFGKKLSAGKISRIMRPYREFALEAFSSLRPEVLARYKGSAEYARFSSAVSAVKYAVETADRSGWTRCARVIVDLEPWVSKMDSRYPLGFVLLASARIMSRIFGQREVPMRVLWNNRQFSNLKYANTIGDLHDKIPVLVNADKDDCLSAARDFYAAAEHKLKEGFHYIYMLRRDMEARASVFPCPCSLNYLGEVTGPAFSWYAGDITKIRLAASTPSQYNITALKHGLKLVLILLGGLPAEERLTGLLPEGSAAIEVERFGAWDTCAVPKGGT